MRVGARVLFSCRPPAGSYEEARPRAKSRPGFLSPWDLSAPPIKDNVVLQPGRHHPIHPLEQDILVYTSCLGAATNTPHVSVGDDANIVIRLVAQQLLQLQ